MRGHPAGSTPGKPTGAAPPPGGSPRDRPPGPPRAAAEHAVLVSILVLVLGLRIVYVLLAAPAPVSSDASGYDAAARRLVATGSYAFPIGRGLWAEDQVREDSLGVFFRMPPNAWSMPGYAAWVAGVYRLFGTGPDRFVAVRLLQAVLSVGMLALCFWIARSVVDGPAGWVALAFGALYPPQTWAAGYLLTETLFTFLLIAQVVLMIRALRSRGWTVWVLLGVATAAAGYVRPVALPVPACLAAVEIVRWLRTGRSRSVLATLVARFAACALAVAMLMAPWGWRNLRVYGTFLPLTSAAVLPPLQGELFVRGIYLPETFAQFADMTPDGNDDHRFARRMAHDVRSQLSPASPADQMRFQRIRARMLAISLVTPFKFPETPASQIPWASAVHIVIVALALAGLWRARRRGGAVALLAIIPVYFVAVHWWVANLWPRYLYPVTPLLMLLATGVVVRGSRAARAAPGSARKLPQARRGRRER